jgi:integrating conjugative element protein (TIGR03749 family)
LTRYAAQSLYAPLRTVEAVRGITRVNLRRDLALDTLLPSLPVRARALAAWRLEDQYVTAVRLTNTSSRVLDLDPRGLQGDFVAATFQHPNLGPAGDPSDTTVVYVVTRGKSLADAFLSAVRVTDTRERPSAKRRSEGRDAE